MKTEYQILALIIIHYIADFIFQDEKWALGKSKNLKDLLSHTFTYSYVWMLPFCLLLGLANKTQTTEWYVTGTITFVIITFVCHTITDYFTSKVVSRLFRENKLGSSVPNFGAFTMIGFDQVLHYIQLIITYNYVVNL